MQLDQGIKGFSFSKNGPLDMRMDPTSLLTAKEIVNHWSEKALGALFRDYGDEPKWRKAAAAIIAARKRKFLETTQELAELLTVTLGRSKKKLHPATLIFQALRIVVNHELEAAKKGIATAITLLNSNGRIGVLSFHRLEDRIVKEMFKEASFSPKKGGTLPVLRLLTKKPLVPTFEEIQRNIRSRSAKLRFAEKL